MLEILDLLLSLPSVKQLEAGDFDLDGLIKVLTEALAEKSQRTEILQLTGDSAVLVIECLDKVASSATARTDSNPKTHSNVFSTTSELSRKIQYLPLCCWIDPKTITHTDEPHTYGTRTQVYRVTRHGRPVAVKILRTLSQEDPAKLKERFCEGVIRWKYMSCPYILKLGGASFYNGMPATVTPWMPHGNIAEYLEKHPGVDRLLLILGAVRGVKYLHERNVAHGDIKVTSILISDSTPPRAMLADFCFAQTVSASSGMSNEEQCTSYFMAPELLLPTKFGLEKGEPSKEADIYALGMTIYQVLTGKRPLLPRRKARVIRAVILGERPAKPGNAEGIGMTEVLWDLLQECWMENMTVRPSISDTLRRLRAIVPGRTSIPNLPRPRSKPRILRTGSVPDLRHTHPTSSILRTSSIPDLRRASSIPVFRRASSSLSDLLVPERRVKRRFLDRARSRLSFFRIFKDPAKRVPRTRKDRAIP